MERKYTTAQRLQQLMNERNLKQIDILNLAIPYCNKYNVKLGRNNISQYLSGKIIPNQFKLTVLAEALNTNEVWLMGFDVPNVPKDELDIYLEKEKEMNLLRSVLKRKGFLNDDEELSEDDFNRLIDFAKANKPFIIQNKDKK